MLTPSLDSLVDRVRYLLDATGADAKTLSLVAGLSQSHVGQLARGQVANPHDTTLGRIAAATGVRVAWLRYGEGETPSLAEVRTTFRAAVSHAVQPATSRRRPRPKRTTAAPSEKTRAAS